MNKMRGILTAGWMTMTLMASAGAEPGNALFQVATLQGLMQGLYDGDMTFADLAREGDLGLGTFDHLDGEMIAVDGRFFRMRPDGHATPVPPTERTPFALMTRWDPEQNYPLPPNLDLPALETWLTQRLDGPNRFHAFRAEGRFQAVRVRSVPAQTPPYPPLTEVVKQQTVFDLTNMDGVVVGFWVPAYAAGLNAAGFHFHFISADRKTGGHLLALRTEGGIIGLDRLDRLVMQLPANEAFSGIALGVREEEIKQVERQR